MAIEFEGGGEVSVTPGFVTEDMSKTPIEMMLDGLTWVPCHEGEPRDAMHEGRIPFATHYGEMDFMGHKLRCYRLDNGRAVINADDLSAFLALSGFLDE